MTEAEFLSQYMLPDEERKRLLLGNVLLGIGGGLMSGKRGNEIGALGSGAVVGAQMGQQAISDAQRGQIDKLKLRQTWQEGEDKRRAQEASQQVSADISRLFAPQNPTENMPSRAPTVDNAANIPAKRQKWEIYLEAAEKAALARDLPAAKHWAELAEKHKPKFSTTPHIGNKEGRVGNFVLDDMGNEKQLSFAPPPKFMTIDDGKTKQIRNEYLMPETGVNVAMQTTPGQDQSAALQRAQMAQSERHWQAGRNGEQFGTPIQITTPEGGTQLYAPRKGTNQVVPMTDANGNPVNKSASIPQAYKDKSYTLANLRDSVDDYSKTLKTMTGADAFKPDKIAELEAKYGAVQMGAKNLFELGALAGPDIKILEQNLTNPTSFRGMGMRMVGGGLEAQNKVIKDMIDRNERNLAAAYNQRPRTYTPTNSPAANMSDDELRRRLGI